MESYVSLATNDYYAVGALNLGNSLKSTTTSKKISLMITKNVSSEMRELLREVYDFLFETMEWNSNDEKNLELLGRPELGISYTKIYAWTLVQFKKCCFMDADTLVLSNIDDVFEREELSAAPDTSWPDCFNSGVFVYCPSIITFQALKKLTEEIKSFDGGDQGLLNSFFHDWSTSSLQKRLPFTYNVTVNEKYFYRPANKHFQKDIKVIHYAGKVKPWTQKHQRDDESHINKWWTVFDNKNFTKYDETKIEEVTKKMEELLIQSQNEFSIIKKKLSETMITMEEISEETEDSLEFNDYSTLKSSIDEFIADDSNTEDE